MARKLQNQSGMVLILAILIIAAVLAAAAVFSNLIIREIQQSRLIDQSIQAYYLAESGGERALYQVRRKEAVKPQDCDLVVQGSICDSDGFCSNTNPADSVPCVNETKGGLNIKDNWRVSVDNEQSTSIVLGEGESFQIDLFNPYQAAGSDINKVGVTSNVADLTLYGEFINLTKVLNIGVTTCGYQPPVFKDFFKTDADVGDLVLIGPLGDWDVLAECSYTFRLSYPLNSIAPSSLITLTVYNEAAGGDRTQLSIPSRLVIDSQADFGKSLQKVRVRTPIRPQLSGLYDFVLFSEEGVNK